MTNKTVVRTGISFEPELLKKFDDWLEKKNFPNRSEAIRYVIREKIIEMKITEQSEEGVVGTLSYIFNHHTFDSLKKLTSIQHKYEHLIVSTMHAHITEELCLETAILKGKSKEVRKLAEEILAFKGVLNGRIYITTLAEL
ncbi:MAG: nickel-responsive transcriptional regulator NikR [Candidatus Heimdallarchaeaceae archaeon]